MYSKHVKQGHRIDDILYLAINQPINQSLFTHLIIKIGTQCVHVSAIWKLLLDVVLSYTVQNVGFVGFVWCHVCFAALKINETVGKKN